MIKTDPAVGTWQDLCIAHAHLARRLEAELKSGHDLTMAGYWVLHRLGQASGGRLRLNSLVPPDSMTKSGVTRLVDRLERDGLITTQHCPSDRRGTFAVLTPHGLAVLTAASSTFSSQVCNIFDEQLGLGDTQVLSTLLQRLCSSAADPRRVSLPAS